MLPTQFLTRMQAMLGDEYEQFLASYDHEKYQSLRINTLKADKEEFLRQAPFKLEQVPWAENGFYYEGSDQPGKHPYHEAGVYYIQEPSAMVPAGLLEAQPGERILDLCAAPGGKSTQIASAMQGKGLLLCNEIHPARAKILSENVERMGISNAMVTNETPQKLADIFPDYFDRIMVDAPCSGEGMFRKNEEACEQWSEENVQLCADRQDEILDCAAVMVRPGGRIVYSTCTFAPLEDEGSVERFLSRHTEFTLVKDMRLWPHKVKGEGHYAAVLVRAGEVGESYRCQSRNGVETGIPTGKNNLQKECGDYFAFEKGYLKASLQEKLSGRYLKFGDQLYLCPPEMPATKGLKVLRPGLHLGTMKKNRFEPSHALALALTPQDVAFSCDLSADSKEARDYLNGMTFRAEGEKGWYLITVDGYSMGWGKLAGGVMKNHYPKGLRKG
ncbi:MAG: RsmB/NOP family class I SAM-dependent RNA methyltransferase [Lachnospiraceae bacterium]|nr:RsmB/NOP family class I SAM-dependent RNA methyltransferase [Lachnospiraceae bacterium]